MLAQNLALLLKFIIIIINSSMSQNLKKLKYEVLTEKMEIKVA